MTTPYAQSEAQSRRTMTAAARNTKTGEVFYGTSGKPWPAEIHPQVRSQLPEVSLQKWGVLNCAELQTCNIALLDTKGTALADLEFVVVRTSDGVPQTPCLNCQQSLRGATHLGERP